MTAVERVYIRWLIAGERIAEIRAARLALAGVLSNFERTLDNASRLRYALTYSLTHSPPGDSHA